MSREISLNTTKSKLFTNKEINTKSKEILNNSNNKLLNKKTKRSISNILEAKEKRCDICLEYEKYSESKLIECQSCWGLCHKKCKEIETCENNINSMENDSKYNFLFEWECVRCDHAKKLNKNFRSFRYVIFLIILAVRFVEILMEFFKK
jgi:hypothetical protein